MLKKVMSMGLVAFFGVGLMTNTCLAAMSIIPEVLGKPSSNWQSSGEESDNSSDDDPDYYIVRKERREERQREKEDLEKWRKERVQERK